MAMATTASSSARHMDAGFELPLELELKLHDSPLLVSARQQQRAAFRPGVQRKSGAAIDVVSGDRTKKKIARAIGVLKDEYGVSEEMAMQALSYTNLWEDALRFLALQLPSDSLPAKLRAKPIAESNDGRDKKEDSGSLAVVAASPVEDALPGFQVSEPMDSWDDEEEPSAPPQEVVEETAVTTAPAKEETEKVEAEAMSWTQRYLLQLQEEEEREKERKKMEAAMTPEQREMRGLEEQYTLLNEHMRQGKADGKLTKKKQKALSQEIQALRMRLLQLGWNEAEYRTKRSGGADTDSEKKKAKKTEPKENADGTQVTQEDDRLFYARDGRQSRLGFRDDDEQDTTALATAATAEIVVEDNSDDDENYGGGLFDGPSVTTQPAPTPTQKTKAATNTMTTGNSPVLAGFPATLGSWTGKTPRDLLQDYCQKNKYQRPQYKKLSTRGSHLYLVTMDKKGGGAAQRLEFSASDDLFPVANGFRSIDEAKDAVATVAMYALTPHLPLYGMMPPPFRALWLEWERAKEALASASVDAAKQEFDGLVEQIFNAVPEDLGAQTPTVTETVEAQASKVEKPVASAAAESESGPLESWDVDDWDADLSDDDAVPSNDVEEASVPGEVVREEDSDAVKAISKDLQALFTRNTQTEQYQRLVEKRGQLPIASFKDTIIEALDKHDVILVSGETGCGKSTQVPQYILEEMVATRQQGAHCQIVCTQPRRLAAISLAERVSHELGEKAMGQGDSLCGFQIRLENRMTKNTKLLFCTTGILLRKLQDAVTLNEELSHIIVDEVHERDVQNDVLLSMLRTFLETQNKLRKRPLKVILMSATLNAATFQRYFGGENQCPMLTVPGRTFPVQEMYLEDALEVTNFVVDESSPCYRRPEDSRALQSTKITISGRGGTSYTQRVTWREGTGSASRPGTTDSGCEFSDRTLLALERLDESVINYDLIEQLVEYLVTESDATQLNAKTASASILVFMPGLHEISNLLDVLAGNRHLRDSSKFELLPLHSSLSPEDQRRIFDMKPGVVRIIATTNIAETSLTIEDVKVVVDSGRAKEMRHDSATKTNLLEEIWISRANAKQRLGRAGRTSGGLCYRLFSRDTFQYQMQEQPLPEIQRAPLTSLCLQIKSFGVESTCAEFLEGCVDPPDASSVNDALRELYEIGALKLSSEEQEELTTLGSHLAQLPVDVKVGKLLLLGAIFGEFDAISTCAAILETKSPFVAPYGYQKEMQTARQQFAVCSSDLLTDANAFDVWRQRFIEGSSRVVRRQEEKAFCRQFFLSHRSLMEVLKLKSQFANIVTQMGFLDARSGLHKPLSPASCPFVSALLFAGLEPNAMFVDSALSSPNRVGLRGYDGSNGMSKAFVHPGSINAKAESFISPFLTYAVKLHTSNVYLPSCSMVMPVALCVFSMTMEIVFPHRATEEGDVLVRLNDWILLKSSLRSGVLLEQVRDVVKAFVEQRIESPPYKHGNKCEDSDTTSIGEMLSALCRSEFDARDPKQTMIKRLNPPLK